MGRVSRYKKVKSFDPYSKQNKHGRSFDLDTIGVWGLNNVRKEKKRSLTVQKLRAKRKHTSKAPVLDSAYEHGDDFDLNDLLGSLKKEAPPLVVEPVPLPPPPFSSATTSLKGDNNKVSTDKVSVPDQAAQREEEKLVRQLKLDNPPPKANPLVKSAGRMPGESKKAFNRRVMAETRQIIKHTRMEQQNPEKRQRKKEFLNSKKKRKKNSSNQLDASRNGRIVDNDRENGSDSEPEAQRETRMVFGEQVEAPPVFRHAPRGSKQKAKTDEPGNQRKRAIMTSADIEAEQEAMELIRRKAHAQYAQVKAKRKREGDFHL